MRPTIVFVHRGFAESACWDRAIDVLMSRDHRVASPSHPGHGIIAAAK